jgi:hypothetical protein
MEQTFTQAVLESETAKAISVQRFFVVEYATMNRTECATKRAMNAKAKQLGDAYFTQVVG